MVEGIGLLAVFAGLLAGPLVPGLQELRHPRDRGPLDLEIPGDRRRAPGTAFRARLRALAERAGDPLPVRVPLGGRRARWVEVHASLRVPAGGRADRLLVVRGEAHLGEASRAGRLWVQGDARLGPRGRVRALAGDGNVVLEAGAIVEVWCEARGTLHAGSGARLGLAAAAGRALVLERGVTFARLEGSPVATVARSDDAPVGRPAGPDLVIDDGVVWARGRLSLPRGAVIGHDVVVHGDLRIGDGTEIRGNVKCHGDVAIGDGAHVAGHVTSRRHVHLGPRARVDGHVVAGGTVTAARGVAIGRREASAGLHAGGRVRLGPEVRVYGRVTTGAGGVA
jgi:hypothetical protein